MCCFEQFFFYSSFSDTGQFLKSLKSSLKKPAWYRVKKF